MKTYGLNRIFQIVSMLPVVFLNEKLTQKKSRVTYYHYFLQRSEHNIDKEWNNISS